MHHSRSFGPFSSRASFSFSLSQATEVPFGWLTKWSLVRSSFNWIAYLSRSFCCFFKKEMKFLVDSQFVLALGLLLAALSTSINCERKLQQTDELDQILSFCNIRCPKGTGDRNGPHDKQKDNLMHLLAKKSLLTVSDQQSAVYALINRTIGAYHDINDFVVVISDGLRSPKGYNQDNFVVSDPSTARSISQVFGNGWFVRSFVRSSSTW